MKGQTAMNRRSFLKYTAGGTALLAFSTLLPGFAWADDVKKLTKTNDEWKKILTPEQYSVLREEDTEAPYTSALLNEHRKGVFACVACDLPLFNSETKFDSGTGWPSFYDHIPGHIEMKKDYALIAPRTEYHCARCGGHHGHVFDDGPKPTGLRHCNNGVVLKFIAG
jgi:peptide-methionine (R)-S-oxide reductase